MTKAEKHMGVVPPKYRSSPAKPTPAVGTGRTSRGRFGYKSIYQFGRRSCSYTSWFSTEAQRDQSFEAVQRKNYGRASSIELEKVER